MISETLGLNDKVTGPAGKMASGIDKLTASVKRAQRELNKLAGAPAYASKRLAAFSKIDTRNRHYASAQARKLAKQTAEETEASNAKALDSAKTFAAGAVVAAAAAGVAYYETAKVVASVGKEFAAAVIGAAKLRGEAERTAQALTGVQGGDALAAIDKLSGKLGVSLAEGRSQWTKFMESTKGDSKLSASLIKLRADVEAATGSASMADAAVQKVLNAPPGKTAKVFRDVAKAAGVGGDGVVAAQHKLETFDGFVKRIGDAPARIFDQLAKTAAPSLDKVGAAANKAFTKFLQGPTAAKAFDMISVGIEKVLGIVEALIPLVEPFLAGFLAGVEPLGDALAPIGDALAKAFGDDKTSKMKTAEKIGKGIGIVFATLAGIFLAVTAAIGVVAAGFALGVYAAAKLGAAIGNVIVSAINFAKALPEKIQVGIAAVKTKFTDLVAAGKDAGTNMVDGLVNGITAGIGKAVAAAKKLADAIPEPIKKVLKIGSPSKLMHQYGEWTAQGLEQGVDSGSGGVRSAGKDLGAAAAVGVVSSRPSAAGAAIGRGASQPISVQINVTAQPGATKADGEALAAGMRPELVRTFRALLSAQALELAP